MENFGHSRSNNLAEKAKQIKHQTKVQSLNQADESLQLDDFESSISVSDYNEMQLEQKNQLSNQLGENLFHVPFANNADSYQKLKVLSKLRLTSPEC